jgi:hypothetical protein
MENNPYRTYIFWELYDYFDLMFCDDPNAAISRFIAEHDIRDWPRKLEIYESIPKTSGGFRHIPRVTTDLVDWIREHEPEWLEDELVQAWIKKTEDKTGGELK